MPALRAAAAGHAAEASLSPCLLPLSARSYDCAHFSEECVVISLIYIERLLNNTAVKVLTSTWRPIVLAAIIVAQARAPRRATRLDRPALPLPCVASARRGNRRDCAVVAQARALSIPSPRPLRGPVARRPALHRAESVRRQLPDQLGFLLVLPDVLAARDQPPREQVPRAAAVQRLCLRLHVRAD